MTAWEVEHLGYGVDHKTTEAEIQAYTAANRECPVCPGVECWCDMKQPEGTTRRRTLGTTVRGHTEALPALTEYR